MHNLLLLITLFVAQVLGAALPGPDMLIVIRTSLKYGRVHGIATAFGVATLMTTYCALAVFVIAGVRAKYLLAFKILSSIGALYLIYLAYKCLRNAKSYKFGDLAVATGEEISLFRAYLGGALTNMSNPKAVIYFLSIMPFFMQKAHGFFMHLAIVFTVCLGCLLWFLFVACMMSMQKVRDKFSKLSTYLEYMFAVILFVFGIWVLLENIWF